MCLDCTYATRHTSKQKTTPPPLTTCPDQHVSGLMVCHTSNYPVPQMVDISHLLRIHEILQAPRSNILEGLALLIYLLPIEIRTPGSDSNYRLFLFGTWCVCMQRKFKISAISNEARIIVFFGNHHSRHAGYDQDSSLGRGRLPFGCSLYHAIDETTHWDTG